jgi:hypothetical protein
MGVGATLHEALCDAIEAGTSLTRSPVAFTSTVAEHLADRVFWLQEEGVVSSGGSGVNAIRTFGYTVFVSVKMGQDPAGGTQRASDVAEDLIDTLHADPIGGARTDVGDEVYSYPDDGQHVILSLPFTAVLWTAQT